METEEWLKGRFRELAQKCYQNNQYTFTGFLGLSELACFYEIEKEVCYVPYTIWGGNEQCERVMLRFGGEEELGYTEEFPITCVMARPLNLKFADALTHRDFLGALMNLGIERSTLGDIWLSENTGYLFCHSNMAAFLMENLNKVKHTAVTCEAIQDVPAFCEQDKKEIRIQISSERIDAVISKVHQFSRNEAMAYFRQKKVFVNGRQCENSSRLLKNGDMVTVRGKGKFEYLGAQGISKKGKINAAALYYGKR